MPPKDIHQLWQVPRYLPYIQPALTDEIVKDAEEQLGYRLPSELVDLLKTQNGGYIRFTLKDTLHSQIYGIGPYFPSLTDIEWLIEYEGAVSFEIKGLIPFDGDGHWNICLDYRNNTIEPEITYIDTESDYEKPVARSFKEYLGMLELDKEEVYVIQVRQPIEQTLTTISTICNIIFEEPDTFAHGYPIYRSNYQKGWIWISPNKVPDGFVRTNDSRYEELKLLMLPLSLRYPEVDADYLFIQFSDSIQGQAFIDKLQANGLTISALKDLL